MDVDNTSTAPGELLSPWVDESVGLLHAGHDSRWMDARGAHWVL